MIRKLLRRLGGARDATVVLRFSSDRTHVLIGIEEAGRLQWVRFQPIPEPGEPVDLRLTELARLPKGTVQ